MMTEENPKNKIKDDVNTSPLDDFKGKVSDISVEKRWAMSCYLPVVNLLTCALTSVKMVNSKYCRFHARQGIIIFLFWVVATLISLISQTLGLMLLGIFLLLSIAGIVVVYKGKNGKLPIVAQFADKIPEYWAFKTLTGKIPEQLDKDGVVVEEDIDKKDETVVDVRTVSGNKVEENVKLEKLEGKHNEDVPSRKNKDNIL